MNPLKKIKASRAYRTHKEFAIEDEASIATTGQGQSNLEWYVTLLLWGLVAVWAGSYWVVTAAIITHYVLYYNIHLYRERRNELE